jgi:hypothetical protein
MRISIERQKLSPKHRMKHRIVTILASTLHCFINEFKHWLMYGIKISLGCRLEKYVLSGRGKVGLKIAF